MRWSCLEQLWTLRDWKPWEAVPTQCYQQWTGCGLAASVFLSRPNLLLHPAISLCPVFYWFSRSLLGALWCMLVKPHLLLTLFLMPMQMPMWDSATLLEDLWLGDIGMSGKPERKAQKWHLNTCDSTQEMWHFIWLDLQKHSTEHGPQETSASRKHLSFLRL